MQVARWEAVHAAKRKGLSIRRITRETGIHRKAVNKCLQVESPLMTPTRKKVEVTQSDTMGSLPTDIYAVLDKGAL